MEQPDTQEKLTDIEIRLAHMDRALSELSDVVFVHQKQIDSLEKACEELRQRMQVASEGAETGSAEDERPPHY